MHGTRTRGQKMRPPFYRLHALTLDPDTTPEALSAALTDAQAVPDRHRLAEGAVFAAGCRRYLMDTGHAWHDEARTTGDTTWGQSEHRSRLTATTWRCSCGAAGEADDPAAAHAAHVAQVLP